MLSKYHMSEWKTYKLRDVVNILDYKRIPLSSRQREQRRGKYPYYGAQGIIDYINDYIFDGTYLLVAEDGENLRSKKQHIAQLVSGKYWVNNHAHILESNGLCDIRYICYLLNVFDISGYITGSAQPKLNQANLLAIEISLPPLAEQKRIADILSAIDDKIELNRRINANLEQQAQALFDEYFIHNIGKLGNYSTASLTDIAQFLNGLAMQKFRPKGNEDGIPVLKIKELGQGKCDASSDLCSSSIPEEYIINNGDIVFSWSGTLLVDIWCSGICGLNQHLFKVSPLNYPKWLIYFWTKYHLSNFIRIAQDKAVTMGHIKRGDLDAAKVIIPSAESLNELDKIMSPMLQSIISNRIENNNLSILRDTLLPKLMSGEIKA